MKQKIKGELVAKVLAGSWRRRPPPLALPAESLLSVASLLVETGAAGLAWWRFRRAGFHLSPTVRGAGFSPFSGANGLKPALPGNAARWAELHQEYRGAARDADEHEEHLEQLFGRMRSAGLEPILIKGWAAARLYPETGLRPYSDIDLCVPPDQLEAAKNILRQADWACGLVELHEGVPDLSDRSWQEFFQRSRLFPLGETEVRVLGPEDELRQLCLHFWRHHGCRPLWLCDIAAALESLPLHFDWDYFQSGRPVLSEWALCFVRLACRLLGACPAHVPSSWDPSQPVPNWLLQTILWRWGAGANPPPFRYWLRRPAGLLPAIWHRWLNPVRASFRLKVRPSCSPVRIQLLALLSRPLQVAARARRLLRNRAKDAAQPFEVHRADESAFC